MDNGPWTMVQNCGETCGDRALVRADSIGWGHRWGIGVRVWWSEVAVERRGEDRQERAPGSGPRPPNPDTDGFCRPACIVPESRLQPEASASFSEPCADRSLKLAATSA